VSHHPPTRTQRPNEESTTVYSSVAGRCSTTMRRVIMSWCAGVSILEKARPGKYEKQFAIPNHNNDEDGLKPLNAAKECDQCRISTILVVLVTVMTPPHQAADCICKCSVQFWSRGRVHRIRCSVGYTSVTSSPPKPKASHHKRSNTRRHGVTTAVWKKPRHAQHETECRTKEVSST
jgi:hypothetical protein